MEEKRRYRGWAVVAYLGAVAVFAAAVWWVTFGAALEQARERALADLELAADRLVGQLRQFAEIAVLTADHPVLTDLAVRGQDSPAGTVLVRQIADKTGAREIRLWSREGRVLVATDAGAVAGPAFRRAMDGALGSELALSGGQRVWRAAAPVFAGGEVAGAVEVEASLVALESEWRGNPQAVWFTDASGVSVVANRAELLFRHRGTPSPAAEALWGAERLTPFAPFRESFWAGHEIWRLDGGPYLPRRALHLELPLPVIGMEAELLLDIAPVLRLAGLQAAFAAAACLVLGGALFLAAERRRALSLRLAVEARANAELEARVAERTRALEAANAELRREVRERHEAEAALKRAQADLVQAGKLSALGQMSAGLSHELNQPLMAIRSFAENAVVFLDRGREQTARDNLERIAELARRMGRIIRNLRAFARQEPEAMSAVDLAGVVEAVIEMTSSRLSREAVDLRWTPPEGPVMVRGGEVRLQQVLLNLVANALDAMAAVEVRRLEIAIAGGDPVTIRVRDSGPGIAAPERIFDPFYTTKEVGQSEGMGLGLSISYGLIQSFGGEIRGGNHPEGGAEFTIALRPAEVEAAA